MCRLNSLPHRHPKCTLFITDRGIQICLFAFHRIPMLSITQYQSLRYEQMACGHNSASGWLRSQPNGKTAGGCQTSPILQISCMCVHARSLSLSPPPQISKNMFEFCILLLIPSMYVLILKIVFLSRKTDSQKNTPICTPCLTYSSVKEHGYIVHKTQLDYLM